MTLEQAGSFAVAAGILTLLPGSDTFLVLRNTLRHGRSSGLLTTFGICSGLFVHATVSAFGVSAIVRHAPQGFVVLQVVGSLYLGYLGFRSLKWAWRPDPLPSTDAGGVSSESTRAKLLEGFLANVLNPKTMVFYMAFLPQFLRPTDPVWTTSLWLACIHWVEGILWLGFLVAALETVRPVLMALRTQRLLEAFGGILLVGFCLRLAMARI